MSSNTPLLDVRNLHVRFDTDEGVVRAVDGIDFSVDRGETLCIVGESGSGKTVASESISRLIRMPPGRIDADGITFDGRDVLAMDDDEVRTLRGKEISHVFQNPQGSLNHVYTVGWQIREAIQTHHDVPDAEARRRAIDLLERVGIPDPGARVDDYPHEFSGGQKQRVVIAMALASNPSLLIADEPTTALDVTIQAQILTLLDELQEEFGMAVILVTHDLGVVAEIADRVTVMYAGKVMEHGDVYDVFEDPAHPYTRALFECLPGRGGRVESIGGTLPSPIDPPPGCRFADRCPHAVDACREGDQPPEYAVPDSGADHEVSCVHYGPGGDPSVVTGADASESVESAGYSADGGSGGDRP